jgi:hypothetical protein
MYSICFFKQDVCLVIEIVTLAFDIKDFLVVFVTEILVFLGFFHEFAGLVVKGIPVPGTLARGCVQLVPAIFMLFRLCESFFPFFHQVIQHALLLLIRFSFAGCTGLLSACTSYNRMDLPTDLSVPLTG